MPGCDNCHTNYILAACRWLCHEKRFSQALAPTALQAVHVEGGGTSCVLKSGQSPGAGVVHLIKGGCQRYVRYEFALPPTADLFGALRRTGESGHVWTGRTAGSIASMRTLDRRTIDGLDALHQDFRLGGWRGRTHGCRTLDRRLGRYRGLWWCGGWLNGANEESRHFPLDGLVLLGAAIGIDPGLTAAARGASAKASNP